MQSSSQSSLVVRECGWWPSIVVTRIERIVGGCDLAGETEIFHGIRLMLIN